MQGTKLFFRGITRHELNLFHPAKSVGVGQVRMRGDDGVGVGECKDT